MFLTINDPYKPFPFIIIFPKNVLIYKIQKNQQKKTIFAHTQKLPSIQFTSIDKNGLEASYIRFLQKKLGMPSRFI